MKKIGFEVKQKPAGYGKGAKRKRDNVGGSGRGRYAIFARTCPKSVPGHHKHDTATM
jgi:hypothetical protein